MRLRVIGCSGSFPGPDSPASCYLLEEEYAGRTWRVLLDLGNGALGALQRHMDPLALDAVALTHLHPDHYFDLAGLYVLWRYHPGGPHPAIPVFGPQGTARQAARAYGLPEDSGMRTEFDFREYADRPVELGPFTLTPVRVAHPVPAYGLRVACGGRVLAYTGDSGPCEALVDLARDADLLLAEAAFVEGEANPPGLHLTGRDAGEVAAKAGVSELVLTHVPPWYDGQRTLAEAREAFDGPSGLASAGAVYRL